MKIQITLPDTVDPRILDADGALAIAFSSALAAQLECGRVEVSLDEGRKTFLFHAVQSELSQQHAIALVDCVGRWRHGRRERLRGERDCSAFEVQLVDRETDAVLAVHEFLDTGEGTLAEQALGVLWQNDRLVDRLVHKVVLRGRRAGEREWDTAELALGETS